jgi:hypothetical protein
MAAAVESTATAGVSGLTGPISDAGDHAGAFGTMFTKLGTLIVLHALLLA